MTDQRHRDATIHLKRIHAYIHAYIHTCMHTYIPRQLGGTVTQPYTRDAYIHTCIHTYIAYVPQQIGGTVTQPCTPDAIARFYTKEISRQERSNRL